MLHPSSLVPFPGGWPESVSHCAHPTRGVRDRALREHKRPVRPTSLILLVVTHARTLHNPAPASRWTDCTTQPCEHTDFSPLTDPLAHPRPAVSHQRRHLYRPRQYFCDRAPDDARLRNDRSRDGTGKEGGAELAQYADH